MVKAKLLLAAGLLAALPAFAQPVQQGPTVAAIRARDALICGAHPGAPGFGVVDSQGINRGLDADTCRAVAAAILGDANKVRSVVLSSQARLPALQSGQVDLLSRTTTWSHSRDTANGLNSLPSISMMARVSWCGLQPAPSAPLTWRAPQFASPPARRMN
jgi:general L-amino acid transport system substrate-binding protein